MLTASVKGVAALSTAGLLLLGAGSVVRADLGPPSPPGVDSGQIQQQAPGAPDPSSAGAPDPSSAGAPDPSSAGATDPSSVTDPSTGPAADSASAPSAPRRGPFTRRGSKPGKATTTTVIVPAPAGAAEANAVQVNPLDTCLSCTRAVAGSGTARAGATAIRLLGQDISAGEGGNNSGALLALPANPLLGLAVADWETATSAGATSASHARTAAVDLAVGPTGGGGGAITVAVLESTSDAAYQGLSSHGDGANNGARVDIGNGALVIILLHSDASSSNAGSAYVVGVNGTQLVSADQVGQSGIPITIPGVVGVVLLQVGASGGTGNAAVGTVNNLLGTTGQAAGVLTTAATGLSGVQAGPAATSPGTTAGAASVSPSGLGAPATGAAIGLGGLLLLASGGGLLGLCLRRRREGAQAG
jgi:hypothetical protein